MIHCGLPQTGAGPWFMQGQQGRWLRWLEEQELSSLWRENGGTSQGRESQSRRLKYHHNQCFGVFFCALFYCQQQLGSDINNLIRNLENWLGLSGRRSSRKEGR